MNSGMYSNVEDIFDKFCDLTVKEMTSTVRKALRSGGQELVKVTKQNLSREIKNRSVNSKYSDKIEDAVRLGRLEKEKNQEMTQYVHILGTREKTSGTFRARFFEGGTVDRYNKKRRGKSLQTRRYVGRITPRWFFKNAQSQVFPKLNTIYMNEIEKTIIKINSTKI